MPSVLAFVRAERYNPAIMPRYLDPKNDLVFKKIFGQHPELLKSFLNAILPLPQDCVIESLVYLPSENVPELAALKYSIVDVRCFDNHDRHFIVEMQLQWTGDFIKRMLLNLHSNSTEAANSCVAPVLAPSSTLSTLSRCAPSAPCSSSASASFNTGSSQKETFLLPSSIYAVVLLDAPFTEEQEWFHHYRMTNANDGNKSLEDLQLVLIELPKLRPTSIQEKRLAVLWLRFLKEINERTETVDSSLLDVPPIKEALSLLEVASYNEAELLAYDQCWDAVSSEKTLLSGRYKEGKAEGKAEGLAEGEAKAVIGMDRSGLPMEQICQIMKLPQEQVQKIIESSKHS